jgi:RNA polymerase sigma-70 factor (ECF subfamily)
MDDRRRRFETQALPHLDAAFNLARWLTRSDADADDVVQDAMLRAWRAFDQFRGGDIRPWLLAIVRNCWRTSLADSKRRGHVALPEENMAMKGEVLTFPGPSPETAAVRGSEGRKLDSVIASLPEEFREVLILREMEELSYREIATITAVPIGTVMSRLARGRAILREKWLSDVESEAHHGVR